MEADTDRDGKISFEEFTKMVENTDVSMSMTLGTIPPPIFLLIAHPYAPLHLLHLRSVKTDFAGSPRQINSNERNTLKRAAN